MNKHTKKLLSTSLKLGISVLLLYFVFTKINFNEVWKALKTVKVHFLILAILAFIASQWVSAKRLLIIFKEVGFNLSNKSNNILYLIGMFYNFFIPGGIGGDAYKVYVLNKEFKWSSKKLTAALFIDRFLGLTAIGILLCLLSYTLLSGYLLLLIPVGIFIVIVIAFQFIKAAFKSFLPVFTKGLLASLFVQILQIVCVLFILLALGVNTHYFENTLIFLVSSVLSIFSFAGIGVREYIFYEASKLLAIETSTAVSVGLLFSIITAFVSLFGIYFHFRKVKLELNNPK